MSSSWGENDDAARFFPVLGLPLGFFTLAAGAGSSSTFGGGGGGTLSLLVALPVFCLFEPRLNKKSPSCSSYTAASKCRVGQLANGTTHLTRFAYGHKAKGRRIKDNIPAIRLLLRWLLMLINASKGWRSLTTVVMDGSDVGDKSSWRAFEFQDQRPAKGHRNRARSCRAPCLLRLGGMSRALVARRPLDDIPPSCFAITARQKTRRNRARAPTRSTGLGRASRQRYQVFWSRCRWIIDAATVCWRCERWVW